MEKYTIKCCRVVPGDAGCRDVPAFADSLEGAVRLASQMLLAYYGKWPENSRPVLAEVQDPGGRIVARLRVTSPQTTEWIDQRIAFLEPISAWRK